MRKSNTCFNEKVNFLEKYKTKKIALFCSTKDLFKLETKFKVIYKINCPSCFNDYIGKTDTNLIIRLDEHGTKPDQAIYQHLNSSVKFNDYIIFFDLPDKNRIITIVSKELQLHNAVVGNFKILDHNHK